MEPMRLLVTDAAAQPPRQATAWLIMTFAQLNAPLAMSADAYMSRYPDATQWTVSRHYHDCRRVCVRPDGSTSLTRWIADMRRLLPSLQSRSPVELLQAVRQSGLIDLGVVSGREAHRLAITLSQSASVLDVTDASFVSHFPRVDGSGLIIEDDAEAEAFCLRLIELGATVEDIEA